MHINWKKSWLYPGQRYTNQTNRRNAIILPSPIPIKPSPTERSTNEGEPIFKEWEQAYPGFLYSKLGNRGFPYDKKKNLMKEYNIISGKWVIEMPGVTPKMLEEMMELERIL